jgi:hypothetical protein
MKKITPEIAEKLNSQGITHLASVVKSKYNTVYYHVNSIQNLIDNGGKWIPAPYNHYNWHGRIGTNGNHIDWNKTVSMRYINCYL